MKAIVKETGEIVEVNQCSILYDDGRRELMYGKELEEVQGAPDYWTRLEHQYAGMALQGMMAHTNIDYDEIVDLCVEFAHALVEKYKENETNNG